MHSVTIKYETYPLNSDLKETVSHYEEMLNSVKDEYGEGDCLVPVHVGFRAIMNRKIGFSGDFNMEFGQSIMENTIAELEKYYLNIDEVTKRIKSLVESLGEIYKTIHDGPDYLDTLAESYPGALSLVVPNRMVESWHKHLASRNMSNCSVVPFWSFIKLLKNGQHQSMYLFPNTINYHHYETLSHLSLKQPVKAIFLLYAPELTKLRSMIRRQDKYIKLKSGVKDTLLLPEMDIQDDYKQRESTDDLVARLEEGLESDIDTSPYEYSNDVDATTMRVKVIDLNGLTQEVSIGSRVIRIGESGRTLCSIQDLCVGDVILHYSNKSIELLYAQVAEGSNQFKIVERDSELWKNMLRKYLSFEVKSDGDFVINVQKLNELSVVLGISNQYIQDAWIRNLNRVKYPQKGSLHKLLDILLNCGLVSDPERHSIIRSRSLYNSVMISLGQNLSTEVQGIASATTDDVLLDFMTTAVYQNVEEYPILSGFEPEVGAAIVKANFDRMVFLGFTTHDESNKSTNNQDLPVYSGDQIEELQMTYNKKYPLKHLSVRVAWHDRAWNGSVCNNPKANSSCLILKGCAEKRDDQKEQELTGKLFHELAEADIPPCKSERSFFMSSHSLDRVISHPYSQMSPATHGNLKPTPVSFPAYSLGAVPYAWMLKKDDEDTSIQKAAIYGLDFDLRREPKLNWDDVWVQEKSNQHALLTCFFEHFEENQSLVFIYAKQVPFVETSGRVLVGVGRIKRIIPSGEYEGSNSTFASLYWENMVLHSIRPDSKDGFLLPYHKALDYQKEHPDFDPAEIAVIVPADKTLEFSFVSEHVGNDTAIRMLRACLHSFQKSKELGVIEDITAQESWIHNELARIEKLRGAYPGLSSALRAF